MKMIYSEKDLPQRSDEWFEFRRNGIGGSEVGVITGDAGTFWNNPYDLFLSKMGKDIYVDNDHMKRGRKYEPMAIELLEKYLTNFKGYSNIVDNSNIKEELSKVKIVQCTAKYKKNSPLFCSYDGVDKKNKFIVELKCPSDKQFPKTIKYKKIPKMYRSQIQSQLLIANERWGIDTAYFVNYNNNGTEFEGRKVNMSILEIKLDKEYCNFIIEECDKFYDMVKNRRWNKYWNE